MEPTCYLYFFHSITSLLIQAFRVLLNNEHTFDKCVHWRVIVVDDIVLEDIEKHTIQLIWFLNNDERLAKYLGTTNSAKVTEQEFLEKNEKWVVEKNTDMFAIVLGGKALGMISLSYQDVINHTARIGYWIGSTYWNKGYGSKAFQLTLDHAKKRKFKCVSSTISKDDIASKTIWDKFGAQTEFKNGKYSCAINISEI